MSRATWVKTTGIGLMAIALLGMGAARASGASEKPSSYKGYIESSGVVKYAREFKLVLGAGEKVSAIHVKAGELVKKGSPMAQLNNQGLEGLFEQAEMSRMTHQQYRDSITVQELESTILSSKINKVKKGISAEEAVKKKLPDFKGSKRLHELQSSLKELLNKQRVNEKKLELLRKRVEGLSKADMSIKERITRLEAQLDALLINAPFDVKIDTVVDDYARAQPGQQVLGAHSQGAYRVRALIWQNQLPYVAVGSKVQVVPNFFEDWRIQATVESIHPSEDAESKNGFPTFPVIIKIEDQDRKLMDGMAVTVRILGPGYSSSVLPK